MRIIINASLLDRRPTGLGIYTQNVLREFSKIIGAEHTLTLFTSDPQALNEWISGTQIIRKIPSLLQPRFGKKAGFARFVWTQLVFPFSLNGQELLYSPTHHGILWDGFRQVITIHDLLAIKLPTQYRLQHYYFAYILPRLIENSLAIITDSESTRQDIHKFYKVHPEKIHVVYGAIRDTFKPSQSAALKTVKETYGLTEFVLTVGASFPHKNITRAIQAFSKVKPSLPQMDFVIAGGRRAYIKVLKHQIKKYNAHGIKFLGYVPPDALAALYSAANALLYPSLYEGFGLPPLEAMACGCPVIASNTSSLPEVCGDAAYYIDPHSVDDMAKALYLVATDQTIRNLLRQKGFERVKLFSWEKAANQIYSVIKAAYSCSKIV